MDENSTTEPDADADFLVRKLRRDRARIVFAMRALAAAACLVLFKRTMQTAVLDYGTALHGTRNERQ